MLEDLRRAGLKMTPQRSAIVKFFAVDESHPTAQALFERLQPEFASMSFATVYNTLDTLTRAGLSTTLRLGPAARFDPNTAPHHHSVCDMCGEVRDVPANDPPDAEELRLPKVVASRSVAREPFTVRAVERLYRGTCRTCAPGRTATSAGTIRGVAKRGTSARRT